MNNVKTLDQLRAEELSLAGEVDCLRHELRRINDALERVGGVSYDLEQQARCLKSNIQLCCEEMDRNQQRQLQFTNQGQRDKG